VQARKAAEIIIFLKEIGIKIIEVSEEIAKDGGILKAKYVSDLSYADAIIISTAVITGCDLLLTYDVEFFKVDEISVMKPENLSGK
jgi:predicted nucleic acid-binding protein